MVQGTSSDAGKSMLVAGICRVLAKKQLKIAPFKPQNMALNSAVTADGGEIGRAQAVQALAAGVESQIDFNPILLKPSSDTGAQVIIHGKAISNMQAKAYHDYKKVAMDAVIESHQRLEQNFDVIVVEGAGSPAEINLREGDIANMGFAEKVNCPVILVADIDRGGVFAQIVGTLALLSESEQNRVIGFVINKFRGDIALLKPGLDWLEAKTNKPVLGVLPYLHGLDIAAEDAIHTEQQLEKTELTIVVPVVPRISNHTDFDALRLHPNINLIHAPPNKPLPAGDLIILPGSKNTRADLAYIKQQGWDRQIAKHLRFGGKLFGICGGYQMLGQSINDPLGIEDKAGNSQGLGYLPLITELQTEKKLKQNSGVFNLTGENIKVSGYEIHCGQTQVMTPLTNSAEHRPLLELSDSQDGLIDLQTNQIAGCYLHGVLDSPEVINQLANWCGINLNQHQADAFDYRKQQLDALDKLADACAQYLDFAAIEAAIKQF
ncbi:cobyric acid synthase [Catenovulum sp. 2E275]|uniref:cobyric acid synthase n=1 Tax=Catenovulum sp. 2E275 TaxID=2980497 RepID=UPI0021CE2ED4|nr:cobyric acid synthase [Catenovulum sp. 2E275]MCU4674651.1 cobyric acid synthase [Catenovulum sp. 2E275]